MVVDNYFVGKFADTLADNSFVGNLLLVTDNQESNFYQLQETDNLEILGKSLFDMSADTEPAAVVDIGAGLQLSELSDTRLGCFSAADLDTLAAEVYRSRYIIFLEQAVLVSVAAVEQPLVLQ